MSELASALASEEQKLLACIHCGLCLEACPTYVLTGDENDGPRGRLYLMRAVGEGRIKNTSEAFQRHIDRCLGCRACESVCPAGVEYGELLEASRSELLSASPKRGLVYGGLRLMLRHIWSRSNRLKALFLLARWIRDSGVAKLLLKAGIPAKLSSRVAFGLALLESSRVKAFPVDLAKPATLAQAPVPSAKAKVSLFTGCVTAGLFSRVNEATRRVLKVNGYRVDVPETQVCCGALHAHAGDLEGARKLARQNISAFQSKDGPIITNAGGCGAMLVSYGHLLAGNEPFSEPARKFSGRITDISQQLNFPGLVQGLCVGSEQVTYDASCHLLYGQKAGEAPLNVLGSVPNLNFVPLAGAERCCGGAGVYNLLEREMSTGVLTEKLAAIKNSGATVLATGNAGCQMQIAAGALMANLQLRTCHPVEILDESYRRAGFYSESED